MTNSARSPRFLRRSVGVTALNLVGMAMIVIGMLLVFSIVAVNSVGRQFGKSSAREGRVLSRNRRRNPPA